MKKKFRTAEGAANESTLEQSAEQPLSTHEQFDQRLKKAETKQHDNLAERVDQGDVLTHTSNTKWIETFKKIDESAEYVTAQKKMDELAKAAKENDSTAVNDYQNIASQRQAHQEGEGGVFDRFKSALGFGAQKELVGSTEAEQEQETPEGKLAEQVVKEMDLNKQNQLLGNLTDIGLKFRDDQKDDLTKVLLTKKTKEERERAINDVMRGKRAA